MPTSDTLLTAPGPPRPGHRRELRARPNFRPDISGQLDPLRGCPGAAVPPDHLARQVKGWVAELDLSSLEAGYSSLGRSAHDPRAVLGVLLYGSLVGQHHASKLAQLTETDLAFRLVGFGHTISVSVLRSFRRTQGALFEDLLGQVLVLAVKAKLIDITQLAVDSMRLRALASRSSVRTVVRSTKRLAELEAEPVAEMSPEVRAAHEAKVEKHRSALARCEEEGRTNVCLTNPEAGLMKFPDGASHPGHRLTAVASRSDTRFVVWAMVDADTNDYGKLAPAARGTLEALAAAGLALTEEQKLRLTADAGYHSEEDLAFAMENRAWLDALVALQPNPGRRSASGQPLYGQEDFTFTEDDRAICPAGTEMKGPTRGPHGVQQWTGVGCESCPLRERCATGKVRKVTRNKRLAEARKAMEERLAEPGAKEQYNRRIATIEPVFSAIQDAMGYRRASSRHAATVRAELQLKILAWNLRQLHKGRNLWLFPVVVVIEAPEN